MRVLTTTEITNEEVESAPPGSVILLEVIHYISYARTYLLPYLLPLTRQVDNPRKGAPEQWLGYSAEGDPCSYTTTDIVIFTGSQASTSFTRLALFIHE